MRLLIDTLIALMLVAVFGGILWHQHEERVQLEKVEAVQQAVRAIASGSLYHAALHDAKAHANGYAMRIDANWFNPRPRNLLVDHSGRWLDYATEDQREFFDPSRIVCDETRATFWYNGYRGIVRARVPMQLSQEATVDLYNLVNGSSVRVGDLAWYDDSAALTPSDATAEVESDSVLRDFTSQRR